jgi:RNA polymerase sigma factor (sigma-70 family)
MLDVDRDLFAAAQAGDRAALERLLSQLQPDIHRYARFQCYASSSIEDVVQEALIVVYRRVRDVRSPAALGAWLVRVVARLCGLPVLMFMRSVEELKTIEDSARFAHMPVTELRMDVARALAALPERYRQIILLRDLEQRSINEIARRLSISVEAAKSLLRRARAAAREQLTADLPLCRKEAS